MRKILCELRRSVISVRMLCCILLGLALLYQPEFYLHRMQTSFGAMDLSNSMQTALGLGTYVMLSTVLCVIPYADRYCWERRTRYQIYAQHRQGKANYMISKLCATAVSGGCSIAMPFLIFCVLQSLIFQPEPFNLELLNTVFSESGFFFLYGSAWATMALGVSTLTSSPLVVLAVPICIERGSQLIAVAFKCDWFRLSDAIAVQCGSVYSNGQIIIIDALLLFVGMMVFLIRMVRNNYET